MLHEFTAYLLMYVGIAIYVWGAQGQIPTEALIKKMETSTTNANRAIKLLRKRIAAGVPPDLLRAFDCSGLGMYWLQNLKKVYVSDMSANSMKGHCDAIGKEQLKKGDWVFRVYTTGSNKGRAYHIGYIVDNALNVVEAKGRDDGVVLRPLNASGKSYWNWYGRPKIFKTEIEGGNEVMLKQGDKGQAVYDFQHACIKAGYKVSQDGKKWADMVTGEINGCDGSFGAHMANVVKSVQAKHGLPQTGEVDAATYGRVVADIDMTIVTALTAALNTAKAKISAAKAALG